MLSSRMLKRFKPFRAVTYATRSPSLSDFHLQDWSEGLRSLPSKARREPRQFASPSPSEVCVCPTRRTASAIAKTAGWLSIVADTSALSTFGQGL
jgi:hypothetical protein